MIKIVDFFKSIVYFVLFLGDGYVVDDKARMDAVQAEDCHSVQIKWLSDSGCDIVVLATLNYPDEGIGFLRAAKKLGVPVIKSLKAL